MESGRKIAVIIPALNEEQSIGKVLGDLPDSVDEAVVIDNGSTDSTPERVLEAGATLLKEPQKGYGAACLKGIDYLRDKDFDIIVFLDGDYSDYPAELTMLIEPIIEEDYDFVLGSRILGNRTKGALLPQSVFGNKLASFLMKIFWRVKFTDLGPFRAIKKDKLLALNMQDRNFGWTVEMQIKAAKKKMKIKEVPVSYRQRIGQSKVTGTFSGTVKASYKILYTIFKYAVS